ncbi:MAG: wax ester/triacylglycerol synthase domain-containing protein, partial [Acidimicrobiales bacterium]
MAEGMRFERRMSDADALMWSNEKDPSLRSTIVAVAILDQAPDRGRLEERLERASRVVPRLRQRVVHSPFSIAPPRWEIDADFDLRYHLRWFRAARPGGLDEVLRVAEPIAMQGFDRARPLWELVVVDGLADGQAATILKLHHAISDGVGAVQIAMNLFDLERDPGEPLSMPDPPPPDLLDMPGRIVDAIQHERRRLSGIARRVPAVLTSAGAAAARDAQGALRDTRSLLASAGRMLGVAPGPASPLMVGRSLRVRFDALSIPLE